VILFFSFATRVPLSIVSTHKVMCRVSWCGNSATIVHLESLLSTVNVLLQLQRYPRHVIGRTYQFPVAHVCACGSRHLMRALVSADTCSEFYNNLF
jgi:hypothetical protein